MASSTSVQNEGQNSPRVRQPRRSSTARGIASPSDVSPQSLSSMSGIIVDQENFFISSSSSFSNPKEANRTVDAAEDGLATQAGVDVDVDVQLENSGGAGKKPAWSKPSNGAIAEIGVVMGAESWPALSESARASPKSPAPSSLKALPHGLVTASQEMAVSSLPSPKEVITSMPNPHPTSNHVVPSRQRSMKRGGSSSSHNNKPPNDSLSQSPSMQQAAVVDAFPPSPGKPGVSVAETSRDNLNKDAGQRGGSYGGNESQQQQRSSFRRSNSGPLHRGDGSYHGGRRDQERGKQDWGSRSFGSREHHGHQQRVGSRPFPRGPVPNGAFIPPPPVAVRPYVAPVVYTEMPSPVFYVPYVPGPHPDSLRPVPMVPYPFFPMPDPQLPSKIVNQIDYYFSNDNLVKDTYLRQNMDGEGWVPIDLIARFKKVAQLTNNNQLILDTLKASNIVEVQGDKVRRKGDWRKWILPSVHTSMASTQSINRSSQNMLATHLNSVTLDEKAAL